MSYSRNAVGSTPVRTSTVRDVLVEEGLDESSTEGLEMAVDDYSALNVVKLRQELKRRGLSQKGRKRELVWLC